MTGRLTDIKARVAQTKELFTHMRAKPKNAWWYSDLEFALGEIERLTRQNTILRGILDRLVCCDTSSEIGQIITGKAAVDAARDYVRERKALAEGPTP